MEGNVSAKYYSHTNQEIGVTFFDKLRQNFLAIKNNFKILLEGESVGYTVKSMEKDFPISNYPLEQTEFLYDSKQGKDKILMQNKKSRKQQYPDKTNRDNLRAIVWSKIGGTLIFSGDIRALETKRSILNFFKALNIM